MENIRRRGRHITDTVGNENDQDTHLENYPEDKNESLVRHLLPEAILGYIWWSTFFSLASTIWFFPLNLLALSGYEAFIALALSPIFTLIPFINRIVTSRYGIIICQILTVVGVLCFHTPTAFVKVIVTSFANFFAMLWLAGAFWFKHKRYREFVFWGMVVGFFLRLVLRMAFFTLNPLWTSPLANFTIFVLGLICATDRAKFILSLNTDKASEIKNDNNPSQPFSSWVTVALGSGSWLFMAQWLFGEVSVISRYTGGPVPSFSVPPIPGGIFTFLSLVIGVALSSQKFVTSSKWWFFGCLSAVVFYKGPIIFGFLGGQGIAVYTMSSFPSIANQLSKCRKGKCLTLAISVSIVLLLASVWVVEYNFVPGGVYARERNDLVLALTIIFIGLAMAVDVDESEASSENSGVAFFDNEERETRSVFRNGVLPALFFLLLVGTSFTVARYHLREENRNKAQLAVKDPKSFTSAVWTVHFGYDNKGWHSFQRAAQVLKDTGADVIGLLETDCSRPYTGSTDFISYVEETLGFYADFGPKTKDHTWGAAILSRYPIIKSTHHLLPSPEGELAPALLASVNISGQIVDFVSAHMGNYGDDLDRQLQAEELARIMDASPNPVVFIGYVTFGFGSRDYLKLLEAGRTRDIDYQDHWRWYEYIFYRDLIRKGFAKISRGILSNTELQLAKFRIPDNVENFDDNNGITTNSEDVPENERFPERFGDCNIGRFRGDGHHYHRSTPKYFVPTN